VILSSVIALLGLALVLHSLWIFHRERSGQVSVGPHISIKFFNTELTGTRPLAIFAIGATLIALPLGYSVKVVTEANTPNLLPGIVPDPKQGEFTEVVSVPEPTYEGFHFHKDVRVIDLRSRIPVPAGKKNEKHSPVTWVRYTLLEKLSEDEGLIDFEFGTSGVGLAPRCLTHENELIKITGPHIHGERKLSEAWQVRVNVERERMEVPFLIINEATYWNAFEGEERQWASMTAEKDTDLIAMVILFPEHKPIKGYDLYAYPHKTKDRTPFRDQAIAFSSENHQVFVWKITQPISGYTYEVDWTW
jgi:hypothetical protein